MTLITALLVTIIILIIFLLVKKKGFNFKEFADEIKKNTSESEYSAGKIFLVVCGKLFSYSTLMIILFVSFLYTFLSFVDLDDRDLCGQVIKLQFEKHKISEAKRVKSDTSDYYYKYYVYFEDPQDKTILHENINSDLYNDYSVDIKNTKHCITVNGNYYGVLAWGWVLLIIAMIIASIIKYSDE